MFTSDIEKTDKANIKTAFHYIFASDLCLIFGTVYEMFSNDVYSVFMLGAFLVPLVFGTLPFLLLGKMRLKNFPSLAERYLYHSGIATLTVGCVMQGILDIYGTTNSLIKYYWIAGSVLTAAALITVFIRTMIPKK